MAESVALPRILNGTFAVALWLGLAGCSKAPHVADPHYQAKIEQWRAQRLARLQAPNGWLGYLGSGRLLPGQYQVGSGSAATLRLPAGPAQLGTLTVDASGEASMSFLPDTPVQVDGQAVQRAVLRLATAGDESASLVQLGSGEFYLVRTGNVVGWRYRETDAAKRPPHGRLEYYPLDPAWRIHARWQALETAQTITLLTSNGTPLTAQVPGQVHFELAGKSHVLRPILLEREHGADQLFFLFSDRTSGRKSYGGGRYLFTDLPKGDWVDLDFNRAQNPPCAITPHVVCPLAPRVNHLELAVTAGEQVYLPGA